MNKVFNLIITNKILNIKKLVLAILFFTCISSLSFAQASNNKAVVTQSNRGEALTPEQSATNWALAIQKLVGFTDDKYQEVYNAELVYYKQSAPGSGNRNPGALPAQRDEKLKGILTTEQYTKYLRNKPVLDPNEQQNR